MQRTLVPAAVAALVLAVAPAAPAKEITKAEVCGADGCSAAAGDDRQVLGNGGPTARLRPPRRSTWCGSRSPPRMGTRSAGR